MQSTVYQQAFRGAILPARSAAPCAARASCGAFKLVPHEHKAHARKRRVHSCAQSTSVNVDWCKERGIEYFEGACGKFVMTDDQVSVVEQLVAAMHRACKISAIMFAVYFCIQQGNASGVWSNGANAVHTGGMAGLCFIAAKSFRGLVNAARDQANSLPHLMLACSRLSVVLGQISAMSIATAVITLVGAVSSWPRLVLIISALAAITMVVRLGSSFFLMTQFGGKGSVVDTISSMQSQAGGDTLAQRSAIMVSASNMLHYPFVAAFAQARSARQQRSDNMWDKGPKLAAVDDALLNSKLDMGISNEAQDNVRRKVAWQQQAGSASADGTMTRGKAQGMAATLQWNPPHSRANTVHDAARNSDGAQACDDDETTRERKEHLEANYGMDPEEAVMEHLMERDRKRDYEFNEGENLIMQMMTDEMRMAGYNQLQYAMAGVAMALANIGTGKYLLALMMLPLLIDISGTAQILFVTTKQFETSILTSGRDIASLILGMGQRKGLSALFNRIANLGKGVILGSSIGIIFQLKSVFGLCS